MTPNNYDILNLRGGLQQIFTLHKSGEVSKTSNFQTPGASGGPSYDVSDLSLDGDVLDSAGDPYSPRYLGTGNGVNVYVVTTTKIYYVEDICGVDGAPTVTAQHTFAVASDYRTLGGERGIEGWYIVGSYYLGAGTKACYTTDGSTWSEVTVSSDTLGAGYNYAPPAGIEIGWTGTSLWKEGLSYAQAPLNLSVIANGLGVRCTWGPVPSGNYKSQGSNFNIDHISGSISSIKMQLTNAGYLGIPWEGWYHTPSGEGDWPPRLGRSGNADDWPDSTSGISGGWEYGWSFLTSDNDIYKVGGYANSYRANPDLGFPGGTYQWDMIITEINGTSTLINDDLAVAPAIHVSGKVAGKAWIGAVNSSVGDLYVTTNYGATWSLASDLGHDFDQGLGGAFMFPWDNNPSDGKYYWGAYDGSAYSAWRSVGTSNTNITPATGYGPADPKCWGSCAQNRLVTALQAFDGANVTGFRSIDGGDNWTTILPVAVRASSYTGVAIGDDPNVMWFWGPAGAGYSDTGGQIVDDRKGDMSTSEVKLLGGW